MSYENETLNQADPEAKSHYIEEEKFQQVRLCQQEIFKEIEFSPSIRKIINELITDENLEKVKKKFLGVFFA